MFQSATIRLTGWYLFILMSISVLFSFAIYTLNVSDIQDRLYNLQVALERQNLGDFVAQNPDELTTFQNDQRVAFEQNIVMTLVYVNTTILFIGGALSYMLARRTLAHIEKAHDSQSRFTSDASHEFKTPLTNMKTELEVALRDPNLTKQEMREMLQSNLEEVDRMSKLAQTLLLLSRLDYANLSYKQTEISGMIADIAQRFDTDGSRIKLTLPPEPVMVYGNDASLMELFVIFIENALKYSPEKSRINVRLTRKVKYAEFVISNKGPGIRPDKLPYIFDRFFRADESRTKGGTGLGLALAKQIIKLHNGTVDVKSTPGKLTKFTVLLPLKKARK